MCAWRWSTRASAPAAGDGAAHADGRLCVGPDNGLLIPAAEACGGIELAVEITSSGCMLDSVSRTFHGRDVFAPVAAHWLPASTRARSAPRSIRTSWCVPEPLATSVEGSLLRPRAAARPVRELQLSAALADLGERFRAAAGSRCARRRQLLRDLRTHVRRRCAGRVVLYEDSERRLSIAINRGNAGELMDAAALDTVLVEFAPVLS